MMEIMKFEDGWMLDDDAGMAMAVDEWARG